MNASPLDEFNVDEARNYWRFAPSGRGKLDSSELLRLPDQEFYALWLDHYESRFSHYWEERRIIPFFAEQFHGKEVLSFGSGLGLNEMQFARAGARLTCADIVETNLRVIERVAKIEGLRPVRVIPMTDSSRQDFGGPYDIIYANGSLMTMPFDQQEMVMANFRRALKPDGRIILMLYTWKFVQDTCGVDSPKAFALRSDPSVGDIHNPWSDWHDDDKLMRLAGNEMVISGKQFWNQDYYVWYGLDWAVNHTGPPKEFLPLTWDTYAGALVFRPDLSTYEPLEARVAAMAGGAVTVQTNHNNYSYAMWSPVIETPVDGELELLIDADLQQGAFSVALLDIANDRMVASRAITWNGRHLHLFPVPGRSLPTPSRIVVSNFREGEPGMSKFDIHELAIVRSSQ